MSADIGEPGHETSGWTHAICTRCWQARNPEREPHRVMDYNTVQCCYCGTPTDAGIYVRDDARKVHVS